MTFAKKKGKKAEKPQKTPDVKKKQTDIEYSKQLIEMLIHK